MTDKLIRDELLRSHRYVSLSSDTAKLLFVHLVLSSDSLSNTEVNTTVLTAIMGRTIAEQIGAELLAELASRDLIRMYEADGKRYAHIPRSRQRIRYLTGKHPRPPASIEDKEISKLIAKVGLQSDRGQTQVGPKSVEVKRSEVKKSKPKPDALAVASAFEEFWNFYPNKAKELPARKAWMKLSPQGELLQRIAAALALQKQGYNWQKSDGAFVPHAVNWLKDKQWNDTPPTSEPWTGDGAFKAAI